MCIRDSYEAPLAMEQENLAKVACECLNLDCPEPDLADWKQMVEDQMCIRDSLYIGCRLCGIRP